MELALYGRDGYYARRPTIGPAGDYYTSPVAHPGFGALLAVQLNSMWQALGRPKRFWAIEAGSGDGLLARDIRRYADSTFPAFADSLQYVAVDRAPAASEQPAPGVMGQVRSVGLPMRGIVGCILSNELLDSFPVRKFKIVDGQPLEIHVTVGSDGRLVERTMAGHSVLDREAVEGLSDGFAGETAPGLGAWVEGAASALDRGFVLTIDYGYERSDLRSGMHSHGTFQTYYRHVDGSSPFQRVGLQDMTAHVDFTALIDAGAKSELNLVVLTTQRKFLKSLGLDVMEASLGLQHLDQRTVTANLRAVRDTANPEGLGGFKVLIQEKRTGIESFRDLLPDASEIEGVAQPTLDGSRLHGAAPIQGSSFELSSLWPPKGRA